MSCHRRFAKLLKDLNGLREAPSVLVCSGQAPQRPVNLGMVRAELGTGSTRVEVRSTTCADFFVFNDGDDPSGQGFMLCKACGRQVEREGKAKPKVKSHKTPYSGKDCPCEICRRLGIHVMLFRGAERNRRRGFHNLFVFYRRLRREMCLTERAEEG